MSATLDVEASMQGRLSGGCSWTMTKEAGASVGWPGCRDYPVKSMGAEGLPDVAVSWHGLAGDRRWAFVRDGMTPSGFPWLTMRERGDMSHYRPSFVDPTRPDRSRTRVQAPSGEVFDVDDPALGNALWPGVVRVIRQDRGVFDTFPVSPISTQTIAALSASVGASLDVQRFRPNILVEAEAGSVFPEDAWVGSVLRVGAARMRVDQRDGRCVVITIDPATTARNPEILRTVAVDRQGCLGVYATTVEPGRIAMHDDVILEAS